MGYLEKFCVLNLTALYKIMKKHDKLLSMSAGVPGAIPLLSTAEVTESLRVSTSFLTPAALLKLKDRLEDLYASLFCNGSADIAKAELTMKNPEYKVSVPRKAFRLGVRIGIVLLLLVWVVWDVIVDFTFVQHSDQAEQFGKCHHSNADAGLVDGSADESMIIRWFDKIFPVYRGMLSLVLWLWCWAALLWAWHRNGINYLLMLGLDSSVTASVADTVWIAANFSIILLSSFLVHFKVLRCDFPRMVDYGSLGLWALIPFVLIMCRSIHPWPFRRAAWTTVFACVVAPTYEVKFSANYVGDVLTSLVKPFVDVSYGFCFYLSGDWLQHLGRDGVCESGVFKDVITPIILLGPYW